MRTNTIKDWVDAVLQQCSFSTYCLLYREEIEFVRRE